MDCTKKLLLLSGISLLLSPAHCLAITLSAYDSQETDSGMGTVPKMMTYANGKTTYNITFADARVNIVEKRIDSSPNLSMLTPTGYIADCNYPYGPCNYTMYYKVILTNTSDVPLTVKPLWHITHKNSSTVTSELNHLINIPASVTCSVEVNALPVLPDLRQGRSVNEIMLTSNSVGSGALSFKPDAYDGNGGLLKNDQGNTLTYSVTGATWNMGETQWTGSLLQNYALKVGGHSCSCASREIHWHDERHTILSLNLILV